MLAVSIATSMSAEAVLAEVDYCRRHDPYTWDLQEQRLQLNSIIRAAAK